MKKILIVDDEPLLREGLKLLFSSKCQVTLAQGGRDALECLNKNPFDLIICDYVMEEGDGKMVYDYCLEKNLTAKFIFFSAHMDLFIGELEGVEIIPKPDIDRLNQHVLKFLL